MSSLFKEGGRSIAPGERRRLRDNLQTCLRNAQAEEHQLGGEPNDVFTGLTSGAIYEIGQFALNERNIFRIYEKLAEPAVRDDLAEVPDTWYDRLIGVQHRQGFEVLETYLRQFSTFAGIQFRTGIDLATGTGYGAEMLTRLCTDHVSAVDIVDSLLSVADARLHCAINNPQAKAKSYDVVNADILHYNPTQEFDVVLCQGIDPYLNNRERDTLAQMVAHILTPNGIYASYAIARSTYYTKTARAQLAGAVVETILNRSFRYDTGDTHRGDPLMKKIPGFVTAVSIVDRTTRYQDAFQVTLSSRKT